MIPRGGPSRGWIDTVTVVQTWAGQVDCDPGSIVGGREYLSEVPDWVDA
jgi:hypothetical protein